MSALLAACQRGPSAEQEEILSNLRQAGFPENDLQLRGGDVYVGRDAHVTLQASREMRDDWLAEGCGRPSNLVGESVTRICVNPSESFSSHSRLSQGLDAALSNYNEAGLRITFARGPADGCTANILADTVSGTEASSGFPSGGRPYGEIKIGTGLQDHGVELSERVITHALGHTLGFRHPDYFDRGISCGGSADAGGSVMNSCFRSNGSSEWTHSDRTALNFAY